MKIEERHKLVSQRRKKIILLGFFSIVITILGLLFLLRLDFVSAKLMIGERTIIIAGVILLLGGLGLFINTYLNFIPIRFRSYEPYDDDFENIDLNSLFNNHLKRNFIDKYEDNYQETDKLNLFENELNSFKEKFIEQSIHDLEYAHLFEELHKLENKFKSQIERLISNSNLNLIIGIVTTSLAIIILGVSIFQEKEFHSTVDLLSFFIPRLSTVIFVEIFSFFFLNLYKSNLIEIKYFQNEITNLNFKITSLKTAIKTNDGETISKVVTSFSQIERNFVLKKDETTERIQINNSEDNQASSFTKSITELINSIKK